MGPKKHTDDKRKLFQYSPLKVSRALDAVRDGMKVAKAAITFNVPRSTLRNKLSGRAPESSGKVGQSAVLGDAAEELLVKWVKSCAKTGFPINKENLLDSVEKIVREGQLRKHHLSMADLDVSGLMLL